MKNYRGKVAYLLPVLFLPAIFSLLALLDGEFLNTLDFFVSFWLFSLALVSVSLGYKIEIQNDLVIEKFIGIKIKKFQSGNVEHITYGGVSLFQFINPVFGLPHGKGIVLLVNIGGVRKKYCFSEKLYGKESIEYIRSILSNSLKPLMHNSENELTAEDKLNRAKMRENRILRRGTFFNAVSEILFKHDPIGLDFENNIDEYDYEAKLIIEKIDQQKNATELTELIYSTFVLAFDKKIAGSKKKYEFIAKEIWEHKTLFGN